MPETNPNKFHELINGETIAAITCRQRLRSVEADDLPIFPPTYPMTIYRGRVHTVRDGEYRVSVELPPATRPGGEKAEKQQDSEEQAGDYNIDPTRDCRNVCVIDSPQSQANRIEPLFKSNELSGLVPQITIKVGTKVVNLLDAGHRAADAVVRLSSLCHEFHEAFVAARNGNHVPLAKLAPTSLLFGVWDSRGTQVKLPRLIRATIRAYDVEKLTRSAQFNPAADYVAAGAVDEAIDQGSGDKNPLSSEGLKHSLATRTHGGVLVHGPIYRDVTVNLAALRQLKALGDDGKADEDRTRVLHRYILGLILVAMTRRATLNLREGCHLKPAGDAVMKKVPYEGEDSAWAASADEASVFAKAARDAFDATFKPDWGPREALFEKGVADEFLGLTKKERDKLARTGPITAARLREQKAKGAAPLKPVEEALKAIKGQVPKKTDSGARVEGLFKPVLDAVDEVSKDHPEDDLVVGACEDMRKLISSDTNSHETNKAINERVKAYKYAAKATSTVSVGANSEGSAV